MSVLEMLKRRDFKVLSNNPTEKLVFQKNFSKTSQKKLIQLLDSYGFRTLLKDAILYKKDFGLKDLEKYCSKETAKVYLQQLLRLKIAKQKSKGTFQLTHSKQVYSLGETLEWYLAQLMQEELGCDALWNVVLEGIPSGGDFDVLSEVENQLLYIEVKSGPPKSIEIANIHAFLARVEHLRPNFAIFFEDTTLRMKDKIVKIFEEELGKPMERIKNETFRLDNLYITNSKPGILENLHHCIADNLRNVGAHAGAPLR
jgi:hypothetical protein